MTTQPEWDSNSWPNGVVGTSDGKKLYINKWISDDLGGTWVFDINPDGTLNNMRKFIDMGGDGMSMDALGNVYISNSLGITVFNANGDNILNIKTEGKATNNVFSGSDQKTLFITEPDKVSSIRMNIEGTEKF